MLLLLACSVYCINYEINANVLTISGTGEIDQNGIRSKGDYKKLQKVIIEEGPTAILKSSFHSCSQLKSISISASVISIVSPFFRNNALSEIIVNENNPNYYTENGILIEKSTMTIIRVPTKEVMIPEGIKKIETYAFAVTNSFTWKKIVFPSTLVEFAYEAVNEASIDSISFAKNATITYRVL